ncbi:MULTISPECIES: bifunctional DNA primase/polymerase [Mycobacterium]|uniref:DNA primase n=1 Tax=Mycobacterium colombiense TaxID=339268 RepID=A0A329M1S5_9MYCO|nr:MULTISPECIES: bifunctional DNA primase/polymerase [Mycobacterium]MDM4138779.1 bifunctional DNA primase/polymerase [Mycobacterium sp. FLAC0960]RAV14069.1 DNA primase [Mycobacterium colombiense]
MTNWYRIAPNNREVAVIYREYGFATIPLFPHSKVPAIRNAHPLFSPESRKCRGECGLQGHGFYDASTDVQWAERYWTDHPDHGIGARPRPGQIVLDIDPRHGGDVALAQLEAEYGRLPETMTTYSGRGDGGRHLWFDGVHGPVRSKLCRGVDILCHERNFVVMPPSQHFLTEKPYTFRMPVADIAAASQWLTEMAAEPGPSPQNRPRRYARRLSPAAARWNCRGLVRAVANAAEGQRHSTLYWAACRAAEDGLLQEDNAVYTALADAASGAGLPSSEIERTISDAIATALMQESRW